MKGVFWLGLALVLTGCLGVETVVTVPAPTVTTTAVPSPTPTTQPTIQPTNQPLPGNADVLHVRAVQTAADTWTFTVTVAHPDTGWEDYADGWDVALPDGTAVLPNPANPFTRLLLHPHETEQPFTRSQSGIHIPAGVTAVTVRAHDLVDGFGGQEVAVDLTAVSGPNFEVEPLAP
ncbi:MAG: hypothetical protein ACE5FD_16080 [Anaerolineae bacterium]